MSINYEETRGHFNNFYYYELGSLPDITIAVIEGHDKPHQYKVEFLEEDFEWQTLFENFFPNKYQAVKLAKDILIEEQIMSELTNGQEAKIYAINCVAGRNLSSDYEESVVKAEKGLKSGKSFEQVKDEIREDLKSKYPRS